MKKLLLIFAVLCFASTAFGQAYPTLYSTKLYLKNGGRLLISSAAVTGDVPLILPGANTAGVLTNDGSGGLSWVPITVSGTNTGDVTLAGTVTYLSLVGQVLTQNPIDLSSTNATGTLAAGRFPALLGDVTSTAGSLTTTIAANAVTTAKILDANVTLAKIANIADLTILGNNSGGAAAPIALTSAQTKTLLSLDNVENTALSTWAGSANLITLGTITTGTWQGTAIGAQWGGTGLNTSATATGHILYTSAAGVWSTLAPGNNGDVLTLASGIPSWAPAAGGGGSSFADNVFEIKDDGDATKKAVFQASGITTATTRTYTFPNADGTLTLGSGGTANTVALWSTPTTITNSTITDGAGTVSTTSNLSLTGVQKTLSFTGDGAGVTTFKAGAQGATVINYTLPTTPPTIGQPLTATAVAGTGPYNVALGWSTTVDKMVLTDQSASTALLVPSTDLQFSLAAGANYYVEGILYFTTIGNSTDIKLSFEYTGATLTQGMKLLASAGGDAVTSNVFGNSLASANYNVSQFADQMISIKGFVRTSTAGTFMVEFSNVNNAPGLFTILEAGSYMRVTKVQ